MSDSRPVRVRFAPSPTGDLHIGGIRTALFNWLFARRHGGKFILRIEDTDQTRTKESSLQGIIDGLKWVGLQWDEGPDIGGSYAPYVQSERVELYRKWAQWLLDNGKAYRAYETPAELEEISKSRKGGGYDRRARNLTPDDWARLDAENKPYVIRFKVPLEGETTVVDMVRGAVMVKNNTIQDQVLLKADSFPTYHLANVVDDHFMEISHIIRAEEWLPSAPLHKLLYDAFGWEMPNLAHAPVILKQDGQGKMSKRDQGAAISYFMQGGFFPQAVTNYLCNVGWNYGVKDENGEEIQIFSKEDAAKIFDLADMTNTGTRFDLAKLEWLNGEYIRLMPVAELAQHLRKPLEDAGYKVNMDLLIRVTPLIQERMKRLTEVVERAGFFFSGQIPEVTTDLLIPKKMTAEQTRQVLECSQAALAILPEFTHAMMEETMRKEADAMGLKPGQMFSPIRAAVTGLAVSPPLFETMEILGKDVSLKRIQSAIEVLNQ